MTKIKLGDKELDVDVYAEEAVREDDEEILVRSFEYDVFDEEERTQLSRALRSEKITLSVEGKEPTDVMTRNWSESHTDKKPPYHFRVELIPYKKKYGLQEFTITPIITLIKVSEGLIEVLKEKGVLKDEEINEMANRLFSVEETRNKILESYFGPEMAEYIKSKKEKVEGS